MSKTTRPQPKRNKPRKGSMWDKANQHKLDIYQGKLIVNFRQGCYYTTHKGEPKAFRDLHEARQFAEKHGYTGIISE